MSRNRTKTAPLASPGHLDESARTNNPWCNYYLALEACAFTFYLFLAIIVSFSSISYLQNLWIGIWFGAQSLFPVSIISVVFFVGPGTNLIQLQNKRYWLHLGYTLIAGFLSCAAGIAFIVLKIVYVTSATCRADPTSVCQGHYIVFAWVMFFAGILVLLAVCAVALTITSWRWLGKQVAQE